MYKRQVFGDHELTVGDIKVIGCCFYVVVSIVAFYCLKGLKLIYVRANLSICSPSKDKTYLRTAISLLFCCLPGRPENQNRTQKCNQNRKRDVNS